MKSYTSLEQSRKLAKILPIESADMCFNDNEPCWSLTALLDIFPCSKELPIVNLTRGGWNPGFTRHWFATWEDEDKNVFYSCVGTIPVDAVVELILKLYEQKLL